MDITTLMQHNNRAEGPGMLQCAPSDVRVVGTVTLCRKFEIASSDFEIAMVLRYL